MRGHDLTNRVARLFKLIAAIPTNTYVPGGTDVALADGGTGASLVDPNADRILFWDDSAGTMTWLTPGTGLTITGTTIDASAGGMTLLGTIATTSGTTAQLTGLSLSSYNYLVMLVEGVSFTANGLSLTLATSSTNGAAYGTARNISLASGTGNSDGFYGKIELYGINLTTQKQVATSHLYDFNASTSDVSVAATRPVTNTAAVVNAIQFAGGTFDAGQIKVYGVK